MRGFRPFHWLMQASHHRMSSFASEGTATGASRLGSVAALSNRRLQNVRPAGMTLAAKDRLPARDSSSLLVHICFDSHAASASRRSASFAAGRRSSQAAVSSSIPRNVIEVDGGHTLSSPSANGMFSMSNTASSVLNLSIAAELGGWT